jgi:hypothetical protein
VREAQEVRRNRVVARFAVTRARSAAILRKVTIAWPFRAGGADGVLTEVQFVPSKVCVNVGEGRG